jgi:cell division protein ZipA
MDNIRLILLLVGVVIILGIYLFARLKTMQFSWPRRASRNTPRRSRAVAPALDITEVDAPDEPVLDDFEQMLLDDNAQQEGDPVHAAPARNGSAVNPDQVFSLLVLAPPGVPFRGQMLLGALAVARMEYGDMQIFHRTEPVNGKQKVLFSAANIREPGTFDPAAMEHFTTEGLALFMQVSPGVDAVWAFEAMVSAGRSLADSLSGTLCDARRSVLTRQAIGHMREQVISCQLQQRVAKTAS